MRTRGCIWGYTRTVTPVSLRTWCFCYSRGDFFAKEIIFWIQLRLVKSFDPKFLWKRTKNNKSYIGHETSIMLQTRYHNVPCDKNCRSDKIIFLLLWSILRFAKTTLKRSYHIWVSNYWAICRPIIFKRLRFIGSCSIQYLYIITLCVFKG